MSKADTIFKIPCYIGGFCLIGLFAYLVAEQKPGTVITLIAAALLFLMTRLPDLTIFRLFGDKGLVAEMQRAVDEAKASVEQLHVLAELFAKISVQQIVGGSRWGGMTRKAQSDMVNGIAMGLTDIGIPALRVKAVIDWQKPPYSFDYFNIVMRAALKSLNEKQRAAYDEWSKSFHDKGIGFEPNPVSTETFLTANGLGSDEVIARLLDYKQFYAEGTHRRPELWFANYNDR
jgi:hypothetical protein